MSEYKRIDDLREDLKDVLEQGRIADPIGFRHKTIDRLVWTAVFATDPELQRDARRAIHLAAPLLGARPASIQGLYEARGRKEGGTFTVPAVNIRTFTYDFARALFRAMKKVDSLAGVFEIAKSEIGYTFQRPAEYAAAVLAAAIKEGHQGPVFIQGDHFQASAKNHAKDPEGEIEGIRQLTREAVEAQFYNIDIDMSTLVDLSKPTLAEQQRVNYTLGAELTALIRSIEPKGITVSVGGEIGEVGGKNSTLEEFRAYMDGFREALAKRGADLKGPSKISVQTGTSHGGVPLPDGRVAEVAIDFDVLRKISAACVQEYGIAGCVQHGASTLPEDAFHHFPGTGTCEIHLATGFQNMIYEHAAFPAELKADIYAWLEKNCADEKKAGQTAEQFHYKTRKKGFGPFKRELWSLDDAARGAILADLEERFVFLMRKLGCEGSAGVVRQFVG